jgi:hypothetical protein
MRKNMMYKVLDKHHGEMIVAKNSGDVRFFKSFSEAWAFVTDPIDIELLGEIDLIEVNGAPPGRQGPECYGLDQKDEIIDDLWQRRAFKS